MRNLTQSHRQLGPGRSFKWAIILALPILLLNSCVTSVPPEPTSPIEAQASNTLELEKMAEEGRFLDAALAYSKLATDTPLTLPGLRQHYALRAAELLLSGNYVPQAYQLMDEVKVTDLDTAMQTRHALLSAAIFLARQLPDDALASLSLAESLLQDASANFDRSLPSLIPSPTKASPTNIYSTEAPLSAERPSVRQATLVRFYHLRADAFAQLDRFLDVARERTLLEALITDEEDKVANQEAIVAALLALSADTLLVLQSNTESNAVSHDLSGWLALINIGHSIEDPQQTGVDVESWRERYPEHPALEPIIISVLANRPRVLPLPRKIALILPLNNRYAKAAGAVRDGFLAAYYSQQHHSEQSNLLQDEDRDENDLPDSLLPPLENDVLPPEFSTFDTPASIVPSIEIYDAGDDPSLIDVIYEQAVDDGAEFVVGPLHKDSVNQLARYEQLPVPVLALNYSEHRGDEGEHALPENLFQLSLSPENEARQVAERAWLDGHTRAAIITPSSAWGIRVAKAFSQRWQQFGGHVVEKQSYDAKKSDYSLPIRQLLNVDESQQRQKDLRRLSGSKLEFIPRRRQDIDFIFMAAASKQARLIKPQLRFHHAPKVPVYATSHSYSGSINAGMDRDMDGVLFSDMPWTLDADSPGQPLKTDIEAIWPNASKRYSRLFALGVDAYRVIGELNGLRRNRAEFYSGETGDLYLDVSNRLQRRLMWARFERGIPIPLNDF